VTFLRVLFIKNDLFIPDLYAGTEVNTFYLCRRLIERGHNVAVAARSNHPEYDVIQTWKHDHDCGFPVYRAKRFEDAAATSIAEFRPDVVVCQEPRSWIESDRFGGFKGIAIVLYQHSRHDGFTAVPAPILERATYLANSAQTAAFLKAAHDANSVIVPPVFGIDRFSGLQPHGNNVLFISIQTRKGADIAIKIARERSNVSFIFVESWTENPNETAQLQQLAGSLPNIKLLPNQPDLRSIFQTTRLLLMPSRSQEGWGRTATEVQVCGIPVLGSSRGQLGSTIGPGGIALDPDADLSFWLKAFDNIWNDQTHYRVFSDRAKDHAARLIKQTDAALERFENCLVAAVKRERRLAATRISIRPKQPRIVPLFARSDLAVMWRLVRLSLAALGPPETWPDVCSSIARREIASLPDGGRAIAARIALATGNDQVSCKPIVAAARARRHECAIQLLRGHLPGGWHPDITLEGRHHLDNALARGKGAVLWMAHFAFAGTIVKMAIHAGGYRLGHLTRPEHGFSKTRFGIAVLNPIRTSFENRYLTRRIVYRRERPSSALNAMREVLTENGVVTLTAGAWEGSQIVAAPFLGSTILLAAGPARVALDSSAPLLPVFGNKIGRDHFSVRIGEPIDFRSDDRDVAARLATHDFLTALEPMVLAYPDQWRGWSELIDDLSSQPTPLQFFRS
jgi:glycosyltransferase involved in cell wall biosynthesis/predicted LPLAT superfamily acyltransferase